MRAVVQGALGLLKKATAAASSGEGPAYENVESGEGLLHHHAHDADTDANVALDDFAELNAVFMAYGDDDDSGDMASAFGSRALAWDPAPATLQVHAPTAEAPAAHRVAPHTYLVHAATETAGTAAVMRQTRRFPSAAAKDFATAFVDNVMQLSPGLTPSDPADLQGDWRVYARRSSAFAAFVHGFLARAVPSVASGRCLPVALGIVAVPFGIVAHVCGSAPGNAFLGEETDGDARFVGVDEWAAYPLWPYLMYREAAAAST